MDINERIFFLLNEQKRSAKELSEYIKVSQASVSAWKTGSYPSSKHIIRISEFLGVSAQYLLTGEEGPAVAAPTELSSLDADMLHYFHQLDRQEQLEALKYLQFLNQNKRSSNSTTFGENSAG